MARHSRVRVTAIFSDESNTSVFLRGSLGNVNFCRAINICILHLPLCGFEKFCLGSGVIKNYVQSWRCLFSSLYFSEHLYFLQSIIFRIVLCRIHSVKGFPGGQAVKNPLLHLQCRRPGFDPWVGKVPCRRKWPPTPVFLPGESHGQRSLVGCRPWGHRVGHNGATEACLLCHGVSFLRRLEPELLEFSSSPFGKWRCRPSATHPGPPVSVGGLL